MLEQGGRTAVYPLAGQKVHYTNFLDYLLLDPQSRLFVQNWEGYSELWLRRFLESILPYRDSKAVTAFLDAGRAKSPVFDQLYHECMVADSYSDNSKLSMEYTFHTGKGAKVFTRMAFPVQGAQGWQVIVWIPVVRKDEDKSKPEVAAQAQTEPVSIPAQVAEPQQDAVNS